jgi:nucleotide-binding universal stress UspA family protein
MKALIAVDSGPHAARVLDAVGAWARSGGVEIHLLRVIKPGDVHATPAPSHHTHSLTPAGTVTGQPLNASEPLPRMAESRDQALARAESEASDELTGLAREHMPASGVTVHATVFDAAATAIVVSASQLGADLIVVGSRARSGLSHALLGSVATDVIRRAPVPVLVVGPSVPSA